VPQVTAIKAQQRRRDRANIYLDGEYAFSLQKVLAIQLALGQMLTPQEIATLQAQDVAERAYERTLRYLTYRPRSEQEVQRYLERKSVEPDVIAQVLQRLKRARLLDDAAFAEFWVENREAFRPRGAWALRGELRQKGVASEVIEDAVSDLDEEASAMRAGEQATRRYARLDRETFFRRMLGYLQRRGFGYGISRQVAEHCWAQLQADIDE
jgi:regulatory protein